MLFNSYKFFIFFPVVTLIYFLLPQRFRWMFLLAASCFFYMSFIPWYILILVFLILIDYNAALLIEKSQGFPRRILLWASILSTCLVLFVFKYFNFINNNIASIGQFFHLQYPTTILKIALPIGLSFHTFQSLSYVIEVYRGRCKAERHLGIYALYVLFYPQLVAGPIERPYHLLPQLHQNHHFDYRRVTDGLKLMGWGFFKKMVVADRLAEFVNLVYNDPRAFGGTYLLLATVFFAFQIYGDFSGYTDIARGAAQVMGFDLMENFRRPYLSSSISEFWRRWHISLSSWFRDYFYVSLGGNKVSVPRWYLNLFLTFLVSGLWHGANWTFVIWGALNGFYLIFGIVTKSLRERVVQFLKLDKMPPIHRLLQTVTVFCLITFAWIFFRAGNLDDALYIASHLFDRLVPLKINANFYILLFFLMVMEGVQIFQEKAGSVRGWLASKPFLVRWLIYYSLTFSILLFGMFEQRTFIYFQF